MAEIEHFVDPTNKKHHKFVNVADDCLPLLTAANQEASGDMINSMTMSEAVSSGTIANETIGYFMARTYQFFKNIGIKKDAIRFRQHRCNEMAHYAQDCWDAEIHGSYGWIECVGIAHRGCYDLEAHENATGKTLRARREFDKPQVVEIDGWTIDGAKAGPAFRALAGAVKVAVENLP